ncbi:MAG: carboxylesterase [Gammaproteobacteria bacterium]|nr:MAG: carboxylesterase [Gammaproteobacteria bacterium]
MMVRILTALLLLYSSLAFASEPKVIVAGEILSGKQVDGSNVSAFLGIPFAAAPVGDLRWQGPQKYQPKHDLRDAAEFAPACMQKQRIVDWYRDLAELFGNPRDVVADLPVSEDCLYLNVWSPAIGSSEKLPVMVYIHGGSNRSGWSWEPNYHGHALAQQGVVVVSIAYRLGDFGFFAHPQLDQGPVVANFGLWDQVAALQWIKDHITAFGGDADRITLFGESSGGGNIVALMFAENTDDLFAQVILQSTAGFGLRNVHSLADERQRGVRFAEALGDEGPLTVAQMRGIPADELLQRADNISRGYYHSPVLDGALLSESVSSKLSSGNFHARSMIIGSNAEEWYAYIAEDADAGSEQDLAEEFFPSHATAALAAVAAEPDIRLRMDRLRTAARMLCPGQYFAQKMSAAGADTWMYSFSRTREGRAGNLWRAYHGVELPYVFGTHDEWMETSETDLQVTAATMSYWLHFAKTGNPNGPTTANWPDYSKPGFSVQEINKPVRTIDAPEPELCRLFRDELRISR